MAPNLTLPSLPEGPYRIFSQLLSPPLDAYVGRYQLALNSILSITREGDHLFVQAAGQQKFELFPESDRDYFLKVVDAQITFEIGSQGRGSGLILHQNGLDGENLRVPLIGFDALSM